MKPAFHGSQRENSELFHVPATQQFNFSEGERAGERRRSAAAVPAWAASPRCTPRHGGAEHLQLYLPGGKGRTSRGASNHQGSAASPARRWPHFQRSWAPVALAQPGARPAGPQHGAGVPAASARRSRAMSCQEEALPSAPLTSAAHPVQLLSSPRTCLGF